MSAGLKALSSTLGPLLSGAKSRLKKPKASANRQKTLVVVAPPTRTKARRQNQPRAPTMGRNEMNGVVALRAPAANAFQYGQLNLGMEDMENLCMRYIAGYARVGDGTNGASGTIYFEPAASPLVGPVTCPKLVPIAPGDQSSINGTTIGFGTQWTNQLLQLFRRQRYDELHLSVLPYGAGSSSTSGAQLSVAPYRGAAVPTGGVGGTGSYGTQTAATAPPMPQDVVLSAKGSQSFPSWQPMVFPMTSFIAGGSGPRQNEFIVGADITQGSLPTVALSAFNIPASFAVSGTAPTSLDGQRISVFIVTCRTSLLDFSYLPTSTVLPIGARFSEAGVDAKCAVSIVKDTADAKAPAVSQLRGLSVDPPKIQTDHYSPSPTHSLVERVTKAVAGVRYLNPAEQAAQKAVSCPAAGAGGR